MGGIDIVLMFGSILLGMTICGLGYATTDAEARRRTAEDPKDRPLSRSSATVFFILVALMWAITLMLKVAR